MPRGRRYNPVVSTGKSESGQEWSLAAELWRAELTPASYRRPVSSPKDFRRARRLSRTWRMVLRDAGIPKGASIFEIGVASGHQLLPLSVRGYRTAGIDCSPAMLDDLELSIAELQAFYPKGVLVRSALGDFPKRNPFDQEQFDAVVQFGVVEHILDSVERQQFHNAMVERTNRGGVVISVVPSGIHPRRQEQRDRNLGGYKVPECDYSAQTLRAELEVAGLEEVKVYPLNLLGYLALDESRRGRWTAAAAQILPRRPHPLLLGHCLAFLAVGKRPHSPKRHA